MLVDLIAILLALLLSALYSISPYVIHHSKYTLANLDLQYIYFLLSIVWYFSTQSTRLYDDPRSKLYSVDAYNILKNIFFQLICLILLLFVIKERALTRTFVLVYFALVTVFIIMGKLFIRFALDKLAKRFMEANRVVIVGANELGGDVYKKLYNLSLGYHVVGYIDDEPENATGKNILGKVKDLETILSGQSIDMVIVALSKSKIEYLEKIIEICQNQIVEVKIIPDVASYYLRDYKYSYLGDIPVVSISIDRLSEPYWRFIKRFFDVIVTLVAVIMIFSWLFPLLLVVQKVFNPGPIIYKSERWGKGGKPFWIYKIRTMQNIDTSRLNDPNRIPTDRNDLRVTRFGRFLRKTSLDELPQFYNLLRGDMSRAGPRPLDSKEALLMKQILDNYMIRYHVRPGITGWAQINGYRGGTQNMSLMQKRIDIDNWYMHNWTIGLDIQIIFYTAIKLLKGDINAY